MMVDICHTEGSDYTDVISYYKSHFTDSNGAITPIFRYVCTHPHQDHICGLANLFKNGGIEIANFWDLDHDFVPEDTDKHPTHADDWATYSEKRKSAKQPTVIRVTREDTPGDFWNDHGDRITVLSPSKALIRAAHYTEDGDKRASHEVEIDEMSYALLIKVNDRKVILAGDGRATPFWQDIYDNCLATISGISVLKAGHHGQESAFHEDAVKAMNPALVVFSNSEDDDQAFGAEILYQKALPSALILKTSVAGNIRVKVPFADSEMITYWVEK